MLDTTRTREEVNKFWFSISRNIEIADEKVDKD